MLLLKKPAVISLSLFFLCILFASYSSAYGATSVIPGSVQQHKDNSLPKTTTHSDVVALLEAEDSALASASPLPFTRISEKQNANFGGAEATSANRVTSLPEFITHNQDSVLNL